MKIPLTQESILEALKGVQDPDLHQDIVSLGFVKNIQISPQNKVSLTLELTTPACPFKAQMKEEAERLVGRVTGVQDVEIQMTSWVVPSQGRKEITLPGVKNIIAFGSGKGGVGKSTLSVNIALALAQSGSRVGLLDADIYGPTIPTLLGLQYPDLHGTEKHLFPAERYGLSVISMGFFLPPEKAVIWRGPMLDKLITQFLADVDWEELDYLLIDLPPGTGDVQLTICQKVALTGAVVVSTPQDVALHIAAKAVAMFQQMQTPILGIVENMSHYVCEHCSEKQYIFGESGARNLSEAWEVPFLGEIPLSIPIRVTGDKGMPLVLTEPDSPSAQAFMQVAMSLAAEVSKKNLAKK